MFGGEESEVKLSVDNQLIGVMVDRFGSDIFIIKEAETSFIINIKAVLSPQFYAWLFGLGQKVKILSPESAVSAYKSQIEDIKSLYNG